MTLLERIEKYLKDRHISATRFGRRAVGDPRFVLDLRQGRKPRRRTLERLEAYLQSVESTDPDCIKSEVSALAKLIIATCNILPEFCPVELAGLA
jgi:hypothetical protein